MCAGFIVCRMRTKYGRNVAAGGVVQGFKALEVSVYGGAHYVRCRLRVLVCAGVCWCGLMVVMPS